MQTTKIKKDYNKTILQDCINKITIKKDTKPFIIEALMRTNPSTVITR